MTALQAPELRARDVLGVITHPGTLDDYLKVITRAVSNQKTLTVFYHNQHTLYCYFTSEELRECYRGKTVLVDGMGIIFLYKLARIPVTRDHGLTYVDFIMPLMSLALQKNWRVFHVGQQATIQMKALDTLRQRVPGIIIEGHDGYFDQLTNSMESLDVIRRINEFSTDLLLVGFGTPNQEVWVAAHREKINAPAVLTCGACMEYVAGAVRTPPRWMGRVGLEWSFRLIENPRRFGYRYSIQTCLLGFVLLRNLFGIRPTRRDA